MLKISDLPYGLFKVKRLDNSINRTTDKTRLEIAAILGSIYGVCSYDTKNKTFSLNYCKPYYRVAELLGGGSNGTGALYNRIEVKQ